MCLKCFSVYKFSFKKSHKLIWKLFCGLFIFRPQNSSKSELTSVMPIKKYDVGRDPQHCVLLIFISLLTSYFLKIAHCLAKKCKSFACLFYFVFSVFHYSQTKFGSASSVVSELFVCKTVQQISLIVRIKFSLKTFSFLATLGRRWPNFRKIFHFHHKNQFQKNCVIHKCNTTPQKDR